METDSTPSHSLELNLILVFMFMASKEFGILEKDILISASHNDFGYLTFYRKFQQDLKKAEQYLRPVNVPFKNKFLRDTEQLLRKDSIPQTTYCPYALLSRISRDLEFD